MTVDARAARFWVTAQLRNDDGLYRNVSRGAVIRLRMAPSMVPVEQFVTSDTLRCYSGFLVFSQDVARPSV